ncbi:Aminodeoxychorismate synthase component 1 (ADC synthase) (ADCS) (4-amino-4-deoxychorismate synthase component 1), partial [Durusdinium trenchii]
MRHPLLQRFPGTEHTEHAFSALYRDGGLRVGRAPLACWRLSREADILALPETLHTLRLELPGLEVSGLLAYEAGLALHGIRTAKESATQAPLALIQLFAPENISDELPLNEASFSLTSAFRPDVAVPDYRQAIARIHAYEKAGTDRAQDQALASDLMASDKDRAENLMIVDLLRNDLGQVCLPGSIQAAPLFELRRFSNVQHLVSTVTGTLRPDVDPLDALLAAFPGGSITGAPKKRAMEIIDELEMAPRGFYCGSQFWIDAQGDLDANILIRTFQCQDGQIVCHGGGGIVVDSDADTEYRE